ncbi:hypothetical protein [Streptomyces physcomitrii]|uniref:Uncharacterized protein n=1 Tax=Streptomyces physcomitrii TaxID=2724184 RepID=A0ABX1H211_9ACTN|nr:hypothetical protein [Streptomyces physcomitrii]NKI42399.1 hypothetical protein [Streptomyces physcomitrii]
MSRARVTCHRMRRLLLRATAPRTAAGHGTTSHTPDHPPHEGHGAADGPHTEGHSTA